MKPTLSVSGDNSIFPVVLTPRFHIPHQSFRKTCWPYFWIIIKTWPHQLHYHHAGPVHHLSSELLQQSPNKASYFHPDPSKSVLNTAIRMVLLKFQPWHSCSKPSGGFLSQGKSHHPSGCPQEFCTIWSSSLLWLHLLWLQSHCTPATLASLLPQTN